MDGAVWGVFARNNIFKWLVRDVRVALTAEMEDKGRNDLVKMVSERIRPRTS